jgi:FlaG/FlaF family flagellin (archaellin)
MSDMRGAARVVGTIAVVVLACLSIGGCSWLFGGGGGSGPAPPVAAGCGAMKATVTVRYRGEPSQTTTASVDDNSTAVTWQAAPETTGRTIDGMTATGASAGSGKQFTATGTGSSAGTNFTLTVTGKITGPPRPCTGSGSFTITDSSGAILASGSWTVP